MEPIKQYSLEEIFDDVTAQSKPQATATLAQRHCLCYLGVGMSRSEGWTKEHASKEIAERQGKRAIAKSKAKKHKKPRKVWGGLVMRPAGHGKARGGTRFA